MSNTRQTRSSSSTTEAASFDDVPLNRFHLKITALTFGANFSDGYQLGIIGIALTLIAPQLGLGPAWQGLLGASALIGIFLGSTVVGWAADRMGRQRLYMLDFLLIAVASVLQFFVTGPVELFVLRLLIGFGIGADYALGPTLVAEFVPRRYRGGLLASLTAMWTVGYIAAFFFGNYLVGFGGDSWRWLLLSSAIPAIVVLLVRIGTPESPRWLVSRGRLHEAKAVVTRFIGARVDFDAFAAQHVPERRATYRELFGRRHWRNTAFGVLFYNCQVIPYFAIYTFLPLVLAKINLDGDEFLGDALLNLFLLLGGIGGLWLVAKLTRRGLTIGSFVVMALSLAPIGIWPDAPTALLFPLFLVFTFTMSASSNLDQVYPPELFPTELRSSGVGLLNGMSRIGSAIGTFLLPISFDSLGFSPTMVVLTAILAVGAVVSLAWAPETRGLALD
ncbi:putative MFS transporter [Saccharopolyspora erythraea NRRL 2338]|uniref:Benzoate transport protein (MFS family) n=2 Tax=Saccharopolyspora erythraea TaxID=1836 RepID=A4FJ86_SACEN|nr:MFS transporter [Saccharopolyspora erythraea]EQD82929.1 major facilitator transporter [Saccharopolyspora erythraea D]PFG97782.1 putative MFS transporter [Saccharopolyspora erythraea NRRL 2338]QRK87925.1 MFS transporter [Saccharopolyspora erythraea]CAM04111.1 putative benzoate transport protein (MFS family) [Saccharopolyspora erythraea NRRL 2338]